MKTSRNTLTIMLAVALAAAAAAGVYVVSNSHNGKKPQTVQSVSVPPTPTPPPMVSVLVAKSDIAADTTVTANMVEVKQILASDKSDDVLAIPSQAIGKITTTDLTQGEQIVSNHLADQPANPADQADTFANRVPVGMRAVSINYDEVMGAGALVQPGDHVDVIAVFQVSVVEPDRSGKPGAPVKAVEVEKVNVATYVVQDVQVLAVAQALSPDQSGVADNSGAPPPPPTPTPKPNPKSTATVVAASTETSGPPVARPAAKSVTLAVTPEQAQRLLLSSQYGSSGSNSSTTALHLALRAPGDTTIYNLPPVQDGIYPVGQSLQSLTQPTVPLDLAITNVQFRQRVLSVGQVLQVSVTVKNISNKTIKTGTQPAPGFTYTEGTAYDSLGFDPQPGTWRIGLNFSDASPTQFPYRWGLGRDLKPGDTTTVTGYVKMTDVTPGTQYWVGAILEPDAIVQDGAGATDISVLPAAPATPASGTGATPVAATPEARSIIATPEATPGAR